MDNDRITTAKNRVFYSGGMGFGRDNPISLHTLPTSVYRATGMDQLADIVNCGYVRPKEGKVKGGHKNEVFWSAGGENLFYTGKGPVLETSIDKVKDGQIGSLSLEDLSAVWVFDYEQNCYVDRKGFIKLVREVCQRTGTTISGEQINKMLIESMLQLTELNQLSVDDENVVGKSR